MGQAIASSSSAESKRIEWIDIFRGLAIILVVIGHTTGQFNSYIYQFHMAAFFILSGYSTDIKKRSVLSTIIYRIRTLLIPFFTVFFLFCGLLALLYHTGNYSFFFTEDFPYVGFTRMLAELFSRGNNYTYWMGASWFILVLFESTIIIKVLWAVLKDIRLVFVSSCALFLTGYLLFSLQISRTMGFLYIDIAFIGQFYYMLGIMIRGSGLVDKIGKRQSVLWVILAASSVVLLYFSLISPTTVDYPSRRFGFFLTDALAAVNGALLLFCLANLALKLPHVCRRVIAYIGKNSIGILYIHFIAFKAAFFLLTIAGVMPYSDIAVFTPLPEVGQLYWPFIVALSIAVSIFAWRALSLIPPMAVLLNERARIGTFTDRAEHTVKTLLDKFKALTYTAYAYMKTKVTPMRVCTALICLLSVVPLYGIDVTVNDELKMRLERLMGIDYFFEQRVFEQLGRGLPMRVMAIFYQTLGFLVRNDNAISVIRIISILAFYVCLYHFIKKLTKNEPFSLFIVIFFSIFLPITFEHAVPTAFVTPTVIPALLLLLSLQAFINYIESTKARYMILSCILLVLSLLSYEFMIVFVLTYPLIAFKYHQPFPYNKARWVSLIKICSGPVVVGILYMAATVLTMIYFPSSYEGANLGFTSIESSLKIFGTLITSALPGYYTINSNYSKWSKLYIDKMTAFDMGCLVALSVVLLAFAYLVSRKTPRKIDRRMSFGLILSSMLFGILLPLPNALSKMYQGNVSASSFTSLPVSFFIAVVLAVIVCSIVWILVQNGGTKTSAVLLSAFLLFCIPTQYQNVRFANVHKDNFQRLLVMEGIFDTPSVQAMSGKIAASDLFEARHTLAINKGYWTDFAQKFKKLDMTVNNEEAFGESSSWILFPEDQYFIVNNNGKYSALFLSSSVEDYLLVPADNGETLTFIVDEAETQEGRYFQHDLTLAENPEEYPLTIGQYDDNWLAPDFITNVQTGPTGEIVVKGYYPHEITGQERGTLTVDGETLPFTIETAEFTLTCSAPQNTMVQLQIQCDFSRVTPPDIRELAFLLVDLTAT